MKSTYPTFSIITITYNAEKLLESTVLSVLNQSYPYIEYIIIDGDSTDNTKNVIEQYASGFSYWISEPDKGLYDAMNKGLLKAKGDYIWFLNAGDIFQHGNVVTDMARVVEQNSFPDIVYGETDLMRGDGSVFAARRLKAPEKLSWKSFRKGMLVCHQAFIVKRTIAPEYDLQYRFSSDFDWCIRCLKEAGTVINSRLRLVNYLYGGMTADNRKASLKERYAIMCKYYGVPSTVLWHFWFALRFYWAKITNRAL